MIIHQELALIPEMSITENIFLGNEPRKRGAIDWKAANRMALDLMARVGLEEDPDTLIKDIGVGKQQLVEIAKAFAKDVQAAHPGRADRGAERGRLPAPAGPAARLPLARHHLDHDLAQAERDRGDRRPDHHPARRPDGRDAGRQGRRRRRGPDRARHGRPRAEQPVPGPHPEDRRGLLRGPRLERPAPDLRRAAGLQERELRRPPRRDRRLRRADGRGPHRAGDERLRPVLRRLRVRHGHQGRQGDRAEVGVGRDRPRARVRQRGPQGDRPQPAR